MDELDQDWLVIEFESIEEETRGWSDGIKESFATLRVESPSESETRQPSNPVEPTP
jgi:hypothetical protein